MDWTAKVWFTAKHARSLQQLPGTKPAGEASDPAAPQTPLVTVEASSAALFDAQWCPTHVSVFAVGDGAGSIELWNLLTDSDVSSMTFDRLLHSGIHMFCLLT